MKITRIEAFALRFPRDDDTTTAYTIADGDWRSIYFNMSPTWNQVIGRRTRWQSC